ncbi:MAG: flagellar hook-basal body protein [Lachnospiraceae bacterium]|nr:flagellar hook-basal body protein [Clostridiales bacterium]MDD6292624.1 flagellar hook-basal body protein [Eubacteriales bacterium]MDY2608096.1 flagellar hook-basal body protein [Lachnospiraceae bacterium]
MVRGLYTAYTGMLNQQYRLDTITNNLANATTTGYKREGATSRAFDDVLAIKVKDSSVGYINQNIGKMSLGVKIGENYVDYSQGSLVETENTYDLALEGNGFFSILFTNKNGEEVVKYTRDGSFVTDAEGTLRTKDGDYVLNDAGTEIVVPTDAEEVRIDELGNIYADGEYVDTLGITDFEDYNYLAKDTGENYLIAVDGATETEWSGKIHQGYTEASNINVVSEMVEMIEIARAYESSQKAVKTMDEMMDKSVNNVGKLG